MFRKLLLCCLLPALPSLYAASPDANGFIRDWLIGGPYPSYQVNGAGRGFADDLLAHAGGEASIRPYTGMKDSALFKADKSKLIAGIGSTNEWGFTEDKTIPVEWKAFTQKGDSPVITMDGRFLPIDDYMVVYAATYIESPSSRKIRLRIGSDDDFKVYLNGRLAGAANSSQAITPDQFLLDAELNPGLNTLVFKLVDRAYGCGFCLAISDRSDRPMTDLVIRLDDPARSAMERDRLDRLPGNYQDGFYTDFVTEDANRIAGRSTLTLLTGSDRPETLEGELSLYRNGASVHSRKRKLEYAGHPIRWEENVDLEAGTYRSVLTLLRNGAPAIRFTADHTVQDPAAIARTNHTLKAKQKEFTEKWEKERQKTVDLEANLTRLAQMHKEQYRELESLYAELRKSTQGGPEAFSSSEELPNGAERVRILLNGDNWETAAGFSAVKRKNGYTPPPAEEWRKISLPRVQFNTFYRNRYFPVQAVDPDNPYGELVPLPEWKNFRLDDSVCFDRFWSRLDIDLGENAPARSWSFICEGVNGALKVFLNGKFCGSWEGTVGGAEIPLTGVKAGRNRLELFLAEPYAAFQLYPIEQFRLYGLLGDLYLESSASAVRIAGAAVRTSYRDNTISVTTEVTNPTPDPVRIRLENSCMLAGKVRYRLPAQETELAPGTTVCIPAEGKWNDPELWGIGGKYGEPVLYELVSDLFIDGKPADRSVRTFGFREFWISGSDFYLNGRHILLQGDVGAMQLSNRKYSSIQFPLLRADGINIIRNHDGRFESAEFLRNCDRLGMLAYANMYPVLHEPGRDKKENFIPFDEFLRSDRHQFNLRNYDRWFQMIRNHPSVVILATDNEIYTQAWDTPAQEEFNIRNDRLGALYARYVRSLDSDRVVTRDGDVGTWGFDGKHTDDPPSQTANYHYPDFNTAQLVDNWQTVFGFRPVIFGETLYYSYGAWDGWLGATPAKVEQKAKTVAEVGSLYRKLNIPAAIYMGPSHDCFVQFDETGKGNPWGIKASEHEARQNKKITRYPFTPLFFKVDWPAASGHGERIGFIPVNVKIRGHFNWLDPALPTHVLNAVNLAFRRALEPMPPLTEDSRAEILIDLGPENAGEIVYVETQTLTLAVASDSAGKAWIQLPEAGEFRFRAIGGSRLLTVPVTASYAQQPGFLQLKQVKWKE